MPGTDFLEKQRKQIGTRMDELRPLYEEYLTLEKAQQALGQLREPVRRAIRGGGRGPGRPPGRRSSGRSGAARRGAGRPRARGGARRRSGGTRADQALAEIKANPGITIPELAEKLRIRPNYLYRVTAALQKERRIRRRGRGFYPA
jgi:hypothetical protein